MKNPARLRSPSGAFQSAGCARLKGRIGKISGMCKRMLNLSTRRRIAGFENRPLNRPPRKAPPQKFNPLPHNQTPISGQTPRRSTRPPPNISLTIGHGRISFTAELKPLVLEGVKSCIQDRDLPDGRRNGQVEKRPDPFSRGVWSWQRRSDLIPKEYTRHPPPRGAFQSWCRQRYAA